MHNYYKKLFKGSSDSAYVVPIRQLWTLILRNDLFWLWCSKISLGIPHLQEFVEKSLMTSKKRKQEPSTLTHYLTHRHHLGARFSFNPRPRGLEMDLFQRTGKGIMGSGVAMETSKWRNDRRCPQKRRRDLERVSCRSYSRQWHHEKRLPLILYVWFLSEIALFM